MIETLTHEHLRNKFHNNFDLTNFAINLAKTEIKDDQVKSLKDILIELENLPDLED